MDEYFVEIEGKHDLNQINLMISGEEAGASEFISIAITFHEGRITNFAKFRELPPGTRPKRLILLPHDTPQPPGTQHVWSGVMLVLVGEPNTAVPKNTAVSAYRTT